MGHITAVSICNSNCLSPSDNEAGAESLSSTSVLHARVGLLSLSISEEFSSCLPVQIESTTATSALFREALKITQTSAKTKDAKIPISKTVDTFNKLRIVVGAPSPSWIVGSPLIQVHENLTTSCFPLQHRFAPQRCATRSFVEIYAPLAACKACDLITLSIILCNIQHLLCGSSWKIGHVEFAEIGSGANLHQCRNCS